MPRKNNNISSKGKSRGRPKAAAKTLPAQPPIDLKSAPAPAAVLDQQKLQQLYSSVLKCRLLSERVQEISPSFKQAAPGREAVLAGALLHSRPEDQIVITEDSKCLSDFLRGVPLDLRLVQLLALDSRFWRKEGSPALLAVAQGVAHAREMSGSGRITLVFCGEDAAALPAQREALGRASTFNAPMVCLIEVSHASLTPPAPHRGGKPRPAPPYVPEIAVDGADVVAVFRVAQEAVRRARTGHGPSLIKCVMPDRGGDPLLFIEQYLRRKSAWSDEWNAKVAQEISAQLDSALSSVPMPS